MQRVRIGLTGLACVFLLVLLAAVFAQPSEEAPITPAGVEAGQAAGRGGDPANAIVEPAEPLAELGVAPGKSADSNVIEPVAR